MKNALMSLCGAALKIMLLATILISAACQSAPKPEAKAPLVGWRPLGSWSGRGDAQSDSFLSDSGQLRLKWETKHERAPGSGRFRLTVHSAISGRPLALAVEHRGEGHDVAYVNEDPRLFHLVIESVDIDWSVSVEEAVSGD